MYLKLVKPLNWIKYINKEIKITSIWNKYIKYEDSTETNKQV